MSFSPSVFGGSVMMRRRPLMGQKRHRSRRHHSVMGRGIWDDIKSGLSAVAPHALSAIKDIGVGLLKKKFGLARRHRRSHGGYSMAPYSRTVGMRRHHRSRKVGSAHMIMGARRRHLGAHRRRVRRVGGVRRRRAPIRRGRGPIGSVLGSVLGHVLPW